MMIHGIQKLTLLDYPDKVSCILFTGLCNFRCPYCYNGSLVLHPEEEGTYSEDEIFSFLKKRVGILDGVVITGGEPTMSKDLLEFIVKVKDIGFQVKLDSNGAKPEILRKAIDDKIVDYIAMDVKNSLDKYPETIGVKNFDTAPIKESISLLLEKRVDFEFRTTVVKEFHNDESFEKISVMCKGTPSYYLQSFFDSGDTLVPGLNPPSKDDMERYKKILQSNISNVQIRN